MTIVKVYTQADSKKIAISVLSQNKRYLEKPDSEKASKIGNIIGVVPSLWGKLPVVLVLAEQFNELAKDCKIIEYCAPIKETEKEQKPRPDIAAMKLYKAFSEDASLPKRLDENGKPIQIKIDGFSFASGNGDKLLKSLKREYNFTKADIAAAVTLVLDPPTAEAIPAAALVPDTPTAEAVPAAALVPDTPATEAIPAAVPVHDAPAPVTKTPAADDVETAAATMIQAAKKTGHLIICSAPKAEQPASPVAEDIAAAVDAQTAETVANATAPTSQKTQKNDKNHYPSTVTDSDVIAAADAFAEAITAYCAALEESTAPAADVIPAPRHRRRLNIAPRLLLWLHPARWVAVAFVVCLLSGLLPVMNTSNAAADDIAADDIAAAYKLHPVTVTASTVTNASATLSPVKKLAAPSPVKKSAADAVTLPGQKAASDIATATAPAADDADSPTTAPATTTAPAADANGLTICAGTAWAYTMMNWA